MWDPGAEKNFLHGDMAKMQSGQQEKQKLFRDEDNLEYSVVMDHKWGWV